MVASRAPWAVARLDVAPHHRLLEVGCGHGTAVALVGDQLTTGHVLGIDRSGTAVARARRRNAGHIARGVAGIEQVEFLELPRPRSRFHTVYALNVNLLWDAPAAELALLRRILRPRGRIVLCFEQPSPRHLTARAERLTALLTEARFTTEVEWVSSSRLCVRGQLAA